MMMRNLLTLMLLFTLLAGCAGTNKAAPLQRNRSQSAQPAQSYQDVKPYPSAPAADMTVKSVVTLKEKGGRVDWSPSGNNLIAFDKAGKDGYYDVYTMRPDGSDERCLTCNRPELPGKHMGNPAWHPSGKWIVFQAEKQDHPGGSVGALPGLGTFSDLWLASSDGTRFYRLTNLPGTKNSGVLHPHFSKDGSRLSWSEMYDEPRLFKQRQRLGLWKLKVADFVSRPDGPALANIKEYQPGGPAFYENHGFSADGNKLIFTSNFQGGGLFKDTRIYRLDLAAGRLTRLTDTEAWNEHASFSPDGKKILWGTSFGNKNRGMDWWLMEADGSQKRRLTHFNDRESKGFQGFSLAVDQSWSPKGDQIVGYVQDSMLSQTGKIVLITLGKK